MCKRDQEHETGPGTQRAERLSDDVLVVPGGLMLREEEMERLGGVEGVNRRWGLTYWSHLLSSPEDLWGPAGNTNPGYTLEGLHRSA